MIRDSTSGLDDHQGAVRVDGRWSVAEIVEHLDRTYTGTTKGFERALASGAHGVSPATMATRLRKLFVVTLGFFPTGIEAPRHVVPTGQPALSALLGRAGESLQAFDAVASRTADRWGRLPILDHPILGPFTTADWIRFHQVHTRHHQKQILERRQRLSAVS